MFKRPIFATLLSRLQENRRFIQVLAGPRQVGKTTLAHQAIAAFAGLEAFAKSFDVQRKILVGGRGIPVEEFLSSPAAHWAGDGL